MTIPGYTKEAIDRYAQEHRPVGDFLTAVLSNNLMESFGRADEENRAALADIVQYCYWEIPFDCWGSPAKVQAWLKPKDDMPDDREAYYNERAEQMP